MPSSAITRRCLGVQTNERASPTHSSLNIEVHPQESARESRNSSKWKPIRCWTLFYLIVLFLLILVSSSATSVAIMMQWLASFIAEGIFLLFVTHPTSRRNVGALYAFGLSLILISKPMQSRFYSGSFHLVKPCQKLQNILHDLHFESKLPDDLSYYDKERPLQALGLGNGNIKDLANGMLVHFDRYSRNETERFDYVEHLNLIGNLFDDKGVSYLANALEHPYAYTDTLLLGRNNNLGDRSAIGLASLIDSAPQKGTGVDTTKQEVSSAQFRTPTGQNLTWLELGGTSISAKGLERLYEASGTRPFSYLGFEYTDRWFHQRAPFFRPNPIPSSMSQIDKARYLQELDLTGNTLGDNDMKVLGRNLLQTNVTSLGLTNNKIGPKGVINLIPLLKQLKELRLGINWRIGDRGAVILANALKDPNATVENLSLFQCHVGQKGAEAFLEIFPEQPPPTYVGRRGGHGPIPLGRALLLIVTVQPLGRLGAPHLPALSGNL